MQTQAIQSVTHAIQAAERALAEAKALTGLVGKVETETKTKTETKTAGRVASPEQLATRETISKAIADGKIGLFTVKGLTESLALDRMQCRNAISYFEGVGLISRFAEKLPEGRGQRELIYKASAFDVTI